MIRRIAAWVLLAAGALLVLAGAGVVFSQTEWQRLAAGAGAIAGGLALFSAGIVLRG